MKCCDFVEVMLTVEPGVTTCSDRSLVEAVRPNGHQGSRVTPIAHWDDLSDCSVRELTAAIRGELDAVHLRAPVTVALCGFGAPDTVDRTAPRVEAVR